MFLGVRKLGGQTLKCESSKAAFTFQGLTPRSKKFQSLFLTSLRFTHDLFQPLHIIRI